VLRDSNRGSRFEPKRGGLAIAFTTARVVIEGREVAETASRAKGASAASSKRSRVIDAVLSFRLVGDTTVGEQGHSQRARIEQNGRFDHSA
jgi:hypothetical protein